MKVLINNVIYTDIRNIDFAPETDLYGIAVPIIRVCCDIVVPPDTYEDFPINVGDSLIFKDDLDQVWADYMITTTQWVEQGILRVKSETDLSALDKTTMPAHMYAPGESAGTNLGTVLAEIFEPIASSYDMELAVEALPVKGFAPKQKRRERLLWVLFATGTYLSTGWDGRLSVKRLSEENTNFIPIYETFWKPTITYKTPVTEIAITTYQYVLKVPEYWEDYVIDDTFTTGTTGSTGGGYSEGPTEGGFSSDDASEGDDSGGGDNSGDGFSDAIVGDDEFTDNGGGTTDGEGGFDDGGGNDGSNDEQEQGSIDDMVTHRDVYTQEKDVVTLINTELPAATPSNVVEVTDITLINPDNVGAVAARLAKRYFKQMEVEMDIINNHKFLPGDKVTAYLNPKECVAGYITSCNFKFGTQARSRIKLTMCEKVQMGGGVTYNYIYNNEVVYSEQDETLYPVGITYAVNTKVVTVEGDGHRRTFLPTVGQVHVEITAEDQVIEIPCELALDLYERVLAIYIVDEIWTYSGDDLKVLRIN